MQLNGISSFRKSLRALERVLEHGHIFGPACCDITVAQCHALLEVDRCNGTAMGDLASALDVDRSTATRFIDELVKAGLADRSRTDADRRAVRVVLTQAGKTKAENIDAAWNEYFSSALSGLTEESRSAILRIIPDFVRSLRKVNERMEAEA
ncbi:MAG: MarR family transcriptional regulator [Spirochaetes bacterium]|nr:MarR family transcriptional regulator [Spirochaetota bacterium]